ncbi:MAG: hypothetical protein WC683_02245 [bacterium]
MSDETEGDVLKIDMVLENLDKLAKKIDNDVKTDEGSRDLHDFIQDDLLPNLKMLAEDVRVCAAAVVRHEDAIADLEEAEGASQLEQEDADKILAFVEKAVEIFKAQHAESKKQGLPIAAQLADLIELGESVIEGVKDLVIEEEPDEPEPN